MNVWEQTEGDRPLTAVEVAEDEVGASAGHETNGVTDGDTESESNE